MTDYSELVERLRLDGIEQTAPDGLIGWHCNPLSREAATAIETLTRELAEARGIMRAINDRGYVSECIEEERSDALALSTYLAKQEAGHG